MDVSGREQTTINYAVPVEVDELLHITTLDNHTGDLIPESLHTLLVKIEGVESCDYNGMFGPYIFLEIEKAHDDRELWVEVQRVTNEYLKLTVD